MKAVIGLGNPGSFYEGTRHNIGSRLLNEIQKAWNFPPFTIKKNLKASISLGRINNQTVLLAKPMALMNHSGESVRRIERQRHLLPQDFVIIRDDLDLLFGKIRIKRESGSGGHHGVDSIIHSLGTRNFTQVKIGIRNDDLLQHTTPSDFVLGKLTREEKQRLEVIKNNTIEKILKLLE